VFTTIWKNIVPAIAALKSEARGFFEVLLMHCYITQKRAASIFTAVGNLGHM